MMGWIHREVDIHKCKKPLWDSSIKRGDIWQCDECNVKWRVKAAMSYYDQRDNYTSGSVDYEMYVEPPRYPGVTSWRDR